MSEHCPRKAQTNVRKRPGTFLTKLERGPTYVRMVRQRGDKSLKRFEALQTLKSDNDMTKKDLKHIFSGSDNLFQIEDQA